jgi:NAD(P)-dependent dehydrogenase (short-subunit alcohol dehydrogenase family)
MEVIGEISSKVIMIIRCNRGIGFGILNKLAEQPDNHSFIMIVRSADNGKNPLEELEKTIPKLGERVTIHELEISKPESVDSFVK